jgi:glycerol uptake facilitator-like aquaporin
MSSEIAKKCVAELIGTFWLTLGGCGTAVIAASFPQVGVGLLGVAFAFRAHRADNGLRNWTHLGVPS